jgi:hypothetical protein
VHREFPATHSLGGSPPVLIKKPASRPSPRPPSGLISTEYVTVTVRPGRTVPDMIIRPSVTADAVTSGSELIGFRTNVASSRTSAITSSNSIPAGAAPVLANVSR